MDSMFAAARIALYGIAGICAGTVAMAKQQEVKLPVLQTLVLGQKTWLAGSRASLRVIAQDYTKRTPISGALVNIAYAKSGVEDKPTKLFAGATTRQGTLDAIFDVPETAGGQYDLTVTVSAAGERDVIKEQVTVRSSSRILLTTDKPVYQPGQLIHIRSLALRIPGLSPLSGAEAVIEVEDSKGNKVFKNIQKTSRFGIAAAEFQLASEINQGTYTVRANIGGERVEKKVNVERYVLPKFKLKIDTDRSYYTIGETIRGTIHCDYFFGKPVAGGTIKLNFSTFDVSFRDFAEISGVTDDAGVFEFEQKLPDYLTGTPLEQGKAMVKIEAEVTDTAEHIEKATTSVTVAKDSLNLMMIPEAGRLIAGVQNTVYLTATYPDGSPAQVTCRVTSAKGPRFAPAVLNTNRFGIAEWRLTPQDRDYTVALDASDRSGAKTAAQLLLTAVQGEENLLLRIDRAVARVGEELRLTVLSPSERGTVYIDVIKDGQTVLTRALSLRRRTGTLDLPLTEDLVGTIEIHAYRIARTGDIVRDTRTVIVNPADDLLVAVQPDKDTYLPGSPARIGFRVTDRTGRGLAAALGISVVDESVFALQEMQPGLEKIYFMLEKELAEPKFEIHGVTLREMISTPHDDPQRTILSDEQQQAAKVLLSAVLKERLESPSRDAFTLVANSYTEKLQKMLPELSKRVVGDWKKIRSAINSYSRRVRPSLKEAGGIARLMQLGYLEEQDLIDPWGTKYEISPCGCGSFQHELIVHSAGPDRTMNTDDDIIARGSPEGDREPSVYGGWSVFDEERGAFGGFGGFQRAKFSRVFLKEAEAPGRVFAHVREASVVPSEAIGFALKTDEKAEGVEIAGAAPPRIRQYFPETMYWNPQIITDAQGNAEISLDMADSITTWRLTAMANSGMGLLGSVTAPLRVFQDFFIDIDLPVTLTQNDEVSIPVAVYNYLPQAQKVRLELTREPWFELMDEEKKELDIESGDVRSVYFRMKVTGIGWHKLTVHGFGTKMSDAITREIEVVPDGREFRETINDRLEKNVKKTILIPPDAIPGASKLIVKVYPGFLSQIIEGMDKILQMPFGCFEQTSSTTYPNILVLQYMNETGQVTPEIRMKAEQYINLGYQRLLTFEVQGGGFSWFGNAPANKVLTAYGLMEFADMARVYEIDPNLIPRVQSWLAKQQEKNGSFKPDQAYLHEESWGRIQKSEMLPTAYIAWALAESGYKGEELARALDFLRKGYKDVDDPYTMAILANAFVVAEKRSAASSDIIDRLVDLAIRQDDKVMWKSKVATICYSHGNGADLETTGLATLALVRSGRHVDIANKALTYIIQSKDPNGTWHSTQATIACLRTLLATLSGAASEINADVRILCDGEEAGRFHISPKDSDVMRQVDCTAIAFKHRADGTPEKHEVIIEYSGTGSALYQITSIYYIPWDRLAETPGKVMDIKVAYDRTSLEKDDIVRADVTVRYNGRGTANMVIVDLGVPPGFDVLAGDLEELVGSKIIQKYSLTGRQIIIYLEKLDSGRPLKFGYRLKARFPIRARSPRSMVYQYYNPEENAVAAPVAMVVK